MIIAVEQIRAPGLMAAHATKALLFATAIPILAPAGKPAPEPEIARGEKWRRRNQRYQPKTKENAEAFSFLLYRLYELYGFMDFPISPSYAE